MRIVVTLFVLACYATPALLGHGGLHALYGVQHNCSHHPGVPYSADEHHHACHHSHHHGSQEEDKSNSVPQVPVDSSDENCSLCQYFAQCQAENDEVVLEITAELHCHAAKFHSLLLSSCFDGSHAPRGPPLV